MRRKIKRICFALLALGMIVGNIDAIVIPVVMWVFNAGPGIKTFWPVAILANIEAFIWYKLGYELVLILQDVYKFTYALKSSPPRRWVLNALQPFHDWERTKDKFDGWIHSLAQSKKKMFLTIFAWLVLPGSRVVTAIILGMDKWKVGFGLLLTINTIHVGVSMLFAEGVKIAAQAIYQLFA